MAVKRATTVLAVLSLLGGQIVLPKAARADTGEDLTYAGIGLGAYVAAVMIATAIVYRTIDIEPSAAPTLEGLRRDSPPAVRFGRECGQRDAQINLVCW